MNLGPFFLLNEELVDWAGGSVIMITTYQRLNMSLVMDFDLF